MNKKTNENSKKIIYDLTLICVLVTICAIALFIMLSNRTDGSVAVIELNGERIAEYPLDVDGEYSLNGGTNVLIIKGGEAYMTYADCPDRTCVNTGKVRYAGERIVCLPNKLAVIIEGEGGVDVVS